MNFILSPYLNFSLINPYPYIFNQGITQYLSFCDCFISLSIMSSRFIHAVAYVKIHSFLMLNNMPLFMHHVLFIHSSVDGHLGCFHPLTIVNNFTDFLTTWSMSF